MNLVLEIVDNSKFFPITFEIVSMISRFDSLYSYSEVYE